jgi:outer membrane receptor for ferrienterochelin and colicins
MRYLLISCIFLLNFSIGFSNDPEKKPKTDAMLFGDVKSGNDHIPFATILIKGTTVGTAADATGHFKMTNLPEGQHTIVISAVGYKTLFTDVILKSNTSLTIHAELEPDNIGIEQVVISADRNAKSRQQTPNIVNSISPKLFNRTQNITLSDGLSFSPGLRMENNCQNCGFSQLRMNGLEGPYTQVLINSRPVFSGLTGVYGLELIPANMIERVEVIRGGGSAMYGSNAIAGTINLITKDPILNTFSVESSYGTLGQPGPYSSSSDYSLNMNGSFVTDDNKTGLTLFGFYRNRNPFDANDDGFSELSSINNTTLGARMFQRIYTRGKLTADYFNINEHRRGGNKFDLPLHEADIAESVTHSIHSGAVTFDLLLRDADKFSAYFSGMQVDRDSYYGANQDLSAYGNTIDFTFSSGSQYLLELERFLFAPALITTGIEFNGGRLKDKKLGYYDFEADEHLGNTLVADQQIFSQAAFLQTEWSLRKWVLTSGIRYDHYEVSDRTEETGGITGNVLSPRLNLLYNLSTNLQVRAGYAGGFRAPQIFDEDLHIETSGSRKVIHRNDPDLKQEKSASYSASLNYTRTQGRWQYQFLTEGFYTQLFNPFSNQYGLPDENGVVVYTRTNAEDGAIVQGLNFEFNASPSNRLQMQSGFTIQQSWYEEPQEFEERKFLRSPDHYGYISLSYIPSPRFSLSATGNYTGPMLIPYFGPLQVNPMEGELRRSHSFFDAGLKAAYSFRITEFIKIECNAGIKNIFNSFQSDFDTGIDRDPAYMYGPASPRTIYFGIRVGSLI